ncbi:MAG: hypothetical protein JNK04_25715, partial [Myxococcales bacterium]|nr:hypothetical protein [Myxococcales bacterium]
MKRTRKRAVGCLFGLLIGAFAASACSDLSDVEREQCGNRVVEGEEECDTYEDLASGDPERPSLCAGPADPNACHYVWDSDHLCPTGWKPGQDNRCRRPSGALGAPLGALAAVKGRRPQVADIDLDGQLDVMVDSPDGLATVAFYLAEGADGFDATVGTVAGPNASLVDLTGDGFADVASTVELSSGEAGLSGIVVQRGNAARLDEPRLYPGPTLYPGEVTLAMVPRVDAVPESALDLDFAYAVYLDP